MSDTPEPPAFDPDEVLAVARASGGRRFLGVGSLALLGVMLLYIGIVQSPTFGWRVFLLALGAGALWMTDKIRRATASQIELTQTELRDADGTVIAHVADIEGIDRGFFAFKPSNGFLIKTTTSAESHWRPGMWWRVGRRIGVGGMTPAHHSKQMSEIIAIILAQRDLSRSKD